MSNIAYHRLYVVYKRFKPTYPLAVYSVQEFLGIEEPLFLVGHNSTAALVINPPPSDIPIGKTNHSRFRSPRGPGRGIRYLNTLELI